MKHLIAILVLIAGAPAPPTPLASQPACACPVPEVHKAVRQAGAVFVGEVLEVAGPKSFDENAPITETFMTVKFRVEKAWKGGAHAELSVLTPRPEKSCFAYPRVQKGERYLVYADPASGRTDLLLITICNRTAPLPEGAGRPKEKTDARGFDRDDGSEDVKELEAMQKAGFEFEGDNGTVPL